MRYWTIKIGRKWLFVNIWHIVGTGAIIGVLIFFSISTAFLSISSNINAGKFLKEKKRALELELTLRDLEENINSVNMKLDSIIDLENKERLVWGLPCIDEDIRKLGVGGSKINISNHRVAETRELIEELRRKLNFEVASFEGIYQEIEREKRLIDCTPSILPIYGEITSGFGWRWRPWKEFHKGLDIANSPNTPIVATASGVINCVKYTKGLGLIVEIDHGFGYKTRYGHLSQALVKAGEKVKRGRVIGRMGTTGYTTGSHLHYEVKVINKAVNPFHYIISGSHTY